MQPPPLRTTARTLPQKPGVYLFKDARGHVLYVGKAQSLRTRVLQYFPPSPQAPGGRRSARVEPPKQEMIARARAIETIVTTTDVEALALEASLIQKEQPPYNVRLVDDSSYLYVKITDEPYPQVSLTRRVLPDGAWVRGPYPNARAIRQTLREARKLFPWCEYGGPGSWGTSMPQQACFAYHLGLCPGICVRQISLEDYQKNIERLKRFLDGDTREALRSLRERMKRHSGTQQYEQAARVRDAIAAIERTMTPQNVVTPRRESADVLGCARRGTHAAVAVLQVRHGRVTGTQLFSLLHHPDEPTPDVLRGFLLQVYGRAPSAPPTIVLPEAIPDPAALTAWLRERQHAPIRIATAYRGWKRELIRIATANAEAALQKSLTELQSPANLLQALQDLATALRLPAPPTRIEAYDISNIQGTLGTGSMIVFRDGKPAPSEYRKFRIASHDTPNDVAMMKEVLRRRFGRHGPRRAIGHRPLAMGKEEKRPHPRPMAPGPWPGEWPPPDLVLLDGGKGQLNAGLAVLEELGLDIPIAALAKREEELFLPAAMGHGAWGMEQRRAGSGRRPMAHGPWPITLVRLPRTSPALYLTQRIRDEAHRFTLGYHRLLRKKRMTHSLLEEIPGIGPATRKKLLRTFGSLHKIRGASAHELAAVVGQQRARHLAAVLNSIEVKPL